jgi:hypothetical protein
MKQPTKTGSKKIGVAPGVKRGTKVDTRSNVKKATDAVTGVAASATKGYANDLKNMGKMAGKVGKTAAKMVLPPKANGAKKFAKKK